MRDGAIRLSCLNEDASYQELALLHCELCYGDKPYIKCSATLNADHKVRCPTTLNAGCEKCKPFYWVVNNGYEGFAHLFIY